MKHNKIELDIDINLKSKNMKNVLNFCWKIVVFTALIFVGLTIAIFDGDVHKL
jgi:hypothetical protein